MGASKKSLRVFTFAGVLILVAALGVGLFQEARAVDMRFSSTPENGEVVGTDTFTVNIEIPDGQTVPIEALHAVVEQQASGRSDKVNADVVARAECPMEGRANTGCPSTSSFTTTTGDAITEIEVTGLFANQTGYGYSVGYEEAFGYDNSRDVETTGYGYDTSSPVFQQNGYGYGYGYDLGTRTSYNIGSGYGYGYSGDKLIIQVNVTVDTDSLTKGETHYLTLLAKTGSDTVGDLSTPFTEFIARPATSGTPGGGGAGGGGGGGGPAGTVGLAQAFDVSRNERVKILLENELQGFVQLLVQFNRDCQGCSIHMTSHGGGPPDGVPAVPSDARAIEYFSIEVQDSDGNVIEDAVDEAWLEFEVSQDEMGADEDPSQVAVMHRTNPWEFETTQLTSSDTADPLVYNGTLSGFSTFATAVDVQPPEISNEQPTGSTSAVTPTISADFSDNRGINENSLILEVDGREKSGQSGSLDVTEEGFSFVPAQTLSEGEHDVSVTIQDESGLETTEEWTFRVSDVDCPEPPRITQVQPSEGATGVSTSPTVRVTVQEGSCPISSSVVRVNGQEVSSTLSGGTLTAELSDLGAGETVRVTALVTDTGGNDARKNWQFTTQQEDTTQPGPDGDGNLLWIIIALVVLAVIGVGAYFYTQQEGGGGMGGAGGT